MNRNKPIQKKIQLFQTATKFQGISGYTGTIGCWEHDKSSRQVCRLHRTILKWILSSLSAQAKFYQLKSDICLDFVTSRGNLKIFSIFSCKRRKLVRYIAWRTDIMKGLYRFWLLNCSLVFGKELYVLQFVCSWHTPSVKTFSRP